MQNPPHAESSDTESSSDEESEVELCDLEDHIWSNREKMRALLETVSSITTMVRNASPHKLETFPAGFREKMMEVEEAVEALYADVHAEYNRR